MATKSAKPLAVGAAAPDFKIAGHHSVEMLTRGPLVVVFMPSKAHYANPLSAWRPWIKNAPHFHARGASLIGIVCGGDKGAPEEISTLFPIVPDADGAVAGRFGLSKGKHIPAAFLLQPPGAGAAIPTEISVEEEHSATETSTSFSMSSANLSQISYAFYSSSKNDPGAQAEPMEMLQKLPALTNNSRQSLKYKIELFYAQQVVAGERSPLASGVRALRNSIRASTVMETAKKTGDKLISAASDLALLDPLTDKSIPLRKFTAHGGPVVLTFFSGARHAFDERALEYWQKHVASLYKHEADHVMAITPCEASARQLAKAAELCEGPTLAYLCDPHCRVARGAFGIAYDVDEDESLTAKLGLSSDLSQLPLAATFVLEGPTVQYAFVSDDPVQRAETTKVVKAVGRLARRSNHVSPYKHKDGKKLGPLASKLKNRMTSWMSSSSKQ